MNVSDVIGGGVDIYLHLILFFQTMQKYEPLECKQKLPDVL